MAVAGSVNFELFNFGKIYLSTELFKFFVKTSGKNSEMTKDVLDVRTVQGYSCSFR